jgi:hypothetical protein
MNDQIENLLEEIENLNINVCCITSYDQSVAECVRSHIIRTLALNHKINYQKKSNSVYIFPISKTDKREND